MRSHTDAESAPQTQRAISQSGIPLWRYLVVALFVLHGLIHFMGVVAAWQIDQVSGVASIPTFPAGLAAGSPLILALGALWLIALSAFLLAATGLMLQLRWWRPMAIAAAIISLVVCVAWWHDAWIGAFIDGGILIGALTSNGFARAKGV